MTWKLIKDSRILPVWILESYGTSIGGRIAASMEGSAPWFFSLPQLPFKRDAMRDKRNDVEFPLMLMERILPPCPVGPGVDFTIFKSWRLLGFALFPLCLFDRPSKSPCLSSRRNPPAAYRTAAIPLPRADFPGRGLELEGYRDKFEFNFTSEIGGEWELEDPPELERGVWLGLAFEPPFRPVRAEDDWDKRSALIETLNTTDRKSGQLPCIVAAGGLHNDVGYRLHVVEHSPSLLKSAEHGERLHSLVIGKNAEMPVQGYPHWNIFSSTYGFLCLTRNVVPYEFFNWLFSNSTTPPAKKILEYSPELQKRILIELDKNAQNTWNQCKNKTADQTSCKN